MVGDDDVVVVAGPGLVSSKVPAKDDDRIVGAADPELSDQFLSIVSSVGDEDDVCVGVSFVDDTESVVSGGDSMDVEPRAISPLEGGENEGVVFVGDLRVPPENQLSDLDETECTRNLDSLWIADHPLVVAGSGVGHVVGIKAIRDESSGRCVDLIDIANVAQHSQQEDLCSLGHCGRVDFHLSARAILKEDGVIKERSSVVARAKVSCYLLSLRGSVVKP